MSLKGSLWKVEGAGNDFVLGSGRGARQLFDEANRVVDLCDRRRGIGADGFLLVDVLGAEAISLTYRNADGSRARFCANGTRCAALVAHRLLGVNAEHRVHTDWVDIPARVNAGEVSLELPRPTESRDVELEVDGIVLSGRQVNVGIPHVLLDVDGVSAFDLAAIGPALRRHPALGPDGANISIVGPPANGVRDIRTWEMGVEGETLCCGSAVVAAGWNANRDTRTLRARSGDLLTVRSIGEMVELTGPARIVAELRLYRE